MAISSVIYKRPDQDVRSRDVKFNGSMVINKVRRYFDMKLLSCYYAMDIGGNLDTRID